MDLIIAANSVPLAAADTPPASGTPQYATVGVPGASSPTAFPAYHYNGLVQELMAVIQAPGVVPSRFVVNQLLQAIKRIAGGNVTSLAVSATLTSDMAGFVAVNATAGNVVLTLPAAAGSNGSPVLFDVIRTDATANTVTIITQGTDTFLPLAPSNAVSVTAGNPASLVGNGVSVWNRLMDLSIGTGKWLNRQVLTAAGSTTYVPFPGANKADIQVCGGGGAGGGSSTTSASQSSGGAGGASGSYCRGIFPISAIGGAAIVVGAGGAGVAGAVGGNGSQSKFGTVLTAPGGQGGSISLAQSTFVYAGGYGPPGAVATGGTVNSQVVGGGLVILGNSTAGLSGQGGSSFFGGGGASVSNATSAGNPGLTAGSGGSGAMSIASGAQQAGGNGAAGIVIIDEFS